MSDYLLLSEPQMNNYYNLSDLMLIFFVYSATILSLFKQSEFPTKAFCSHCGKATVRDLNNISTK